MPVTKQLYPNEEKLFSLLCEGDKAAFDQIYNLYWQRLYLYVVKAIRNSEAAEDIVQEIFVSLWLRRTEITEQRILSGYLFAAARFKGINFVQDQLKKGKHISSLMEHFNAAPERVDELMEAKELNSIVNSELEKLPSKMRHVFVLSRREQLSHKEISEKLQISDKTVKKQISNALKHFKMVLKQDVVLTAGLVIHWLCCL